MNSNIFIAFILVFCFFSCTKNETPEAPDCIEKEYGELITITSGDVFCFEDDTELSIVSLNNEYCPCNVECFWEGQFTMNMEWTFPSGETLEYYHNTASQIDNEPLPDGLAVVFQEEDFTFSEPCSESVPSPEIIEARITITK